MDREELLRRYAGGEKDFTRQNFRGSRWNRMNSFEVVSTEKPTSAIALFRMVASFREVGHEFREIYQDSYVRK